MIIANSTEKPSFGSLANMHIPRVPS